MSNRVILGVLVLSVVFVLSACRSRTQVVVKDPVPAAGGALVIQTNNDPCLLNAGPGCGNKYGHYKKNKCKGCKKVIVVK